MTEYNPIAIDVMGASDGVIQEILDCGKDVLLCSGVNGSQIQETGVDEGTLRASTNEECAFWGLKAFFEHQFDLREEDLPRKVSQWLMEKSKELRNLADEVLEVLDDRDIGAIRDMVADRISQ